MWSHPVNGLSVAPMRGSVTDVRKGKSMPHPKGGYKLKNGTKVPGVTTILSRWKESGALLFWAFEQGKCAERGEINSLYDKRDSAASAGTICHSLVELHLKGELPC